MDTIPVGNKHQPEKMFDRRTLGQRMAVEAIVASDDFDFACMMTRWAIDDAMLIAELQQAATDGHGEDIVVYDDDVSGYVTLIQSGGRTLDAVDEEHDARQTVFALNIGGKHGGKLG